MIQKLTLAMVLCLGAAPFALAADKYATNLRVAGTGDERKTIVGFAGECGEECHVATLVCNSQGRFGFSDDDVEGKIAGAIVADSKRQFTIKVGSASFGFYVSDVSYTGDLNGTWSVEGSLEEGSKELAAALGKAKTFKSVVGSQTLTLPVTKDVIKLAKACAK